MTRVTAVDKETAIRLYRAHVDGRASILWRVDGKSAIVEGVWGRRVTPSHR